MRTLTFDPFEFDNPCTEETLELAIGSKQHVNPVDKFLSLAVRDVVIKRPTTPFCLLFTRSVATGVHSISLVDDSPTPNPSVRDTGPVIG